MIELTLALSLGVVAPPLLVALFGELVVWSAQGRRGWRTRWSAGRYVERLRDALATIACWAMGASWLCAVTLLALVIAHGPAQRPLVVWTIGGAHVALLGVLADRLSAVLLLLVTTVSGVVHVYARRAMVGEPRYEAFFARLGLVTAVVALALLSDTLLMLFIFWALKGLALTRLLGHYQERPETRRAARQKLLTDLLGDGAFALALALTWRVFGTFDLGAIGRLAGRISATGGEPSITLIALLLLVAAMAKSALVPLHGWLPKSVESPTPVSALMHAGLINAGGFLLVRLSPLFVAAPVALALAALIGLATALYGATAMRARSDVKGMLAYSTMSQMGFMLFECGLGAFAVAILHLVAHGIYKATMFLGAGDAVRQARVEASLGSPHAPAPRRSALAWGVTLGAPSAVLLGAAALVGLRLDTGVALLVFAWATGAQAFDSALRARATPRWATLAGIAVAGGLYLGLVAGVTRFLAPVTPPAPPTPPVVWGGVALVCAALALLTLFARAEALPPRLSVAMRWLYVTALHAGAPDVAARTPGNAPAMRAKTPLRRIALLLALKSNQNETDTAVTTDAHVSPAAAAHVQACVAEAAQLITPSWPIGSFIATNPLAALEDTPFEAAARRAAALRHGRSYLPFATYQRLRAEGRITDDDLMAALEELSDEAGAGMAALGGLDGAEPGRPLSWEWLTDASISEQADEKAERRDSDWMEAPDAFTAVGDTMTLGDLCDVHAADALDASKGVVAIVNRRMTLWLAAFLDEGQAAWRMPGRERGFYACWRSLAPLDGSLWRAGLTSAARRLRATPEAPARSLALSLERMGIPQDRWAGYLARHLAQLPGWAAAIRWREEHPDAHAQRERPITLVEYLAARLFYEAELVEQVAWARWRVSGAYPALCAALAGRAGAGSAADADAHTAHTAPPAPPKRVADETLRLEIWQRAYERGYRRHLLGRVRSRLAERSNAERSNAEPSNEEAPVARRPAAQALFCIDARSEGLRRHLEASGAYETFGVAGFFGTPFLHRPFGSYQESALCPALLQPTRVVAEVPEPGAAGAAAQRMARDARRRAWRALLHDTREGLLTPFALIEATGWALAAPLVAKTLAPRLRLRFRAWRNALGGARPLRTTFQIDTPHDPARATTGREDAAVTLGWTLDERVALAETLLRSIGLTRQFARLVLLCGHGGATTNNPYAAAFDCGACGGNAGGTNARVAVAILNERAVRERLQERGVRVPPETVFIAGEHITTTDQITLFDVEELPAAYARDVARLNADLQRAGARNAADRLRRLPGGSRADAGQGSRDDSDATHATLVREAQRRAADWAETRPEWGLAGNAAFICGRRTLTGALNLESRAFLHSYDPSSDPEGSALEGILTAPMVVAEWINMQYYFSTVDNNVFGSGTKLLHTVVGRLGVMQGQVSDLRAGLAWQSVMAGPQPDQFFHEPLRLLVVVEAPVERVEAILARQAVPRRLVTNGWITLVVCEPATGRTLRRTRAGAWKEELPSLATRHDGDRQREAALA